jgi:hypothetical protein
LAWTLAQLSCPRLDLKKQQKKLMIEPSL